MWDLGKRTSWLYNLSKKVVDDQSIISFIGKLRRYYDPLSGRGVTEKNQILFQKSKIWVKLNEIEYNFYDRQRTIIFYKHMIKETSFKNPIQFIFSLFSPLLLSNTNIHSSDANQFQGCVLLYTIRSIFILAIQVI